MYSRKKIFSLFLIIAFLVISGCSQKSTQQSKFEIDYEKYTLNNGLEVILHEDNSDPIVAVAIQYHVGSNREEKGKTGFAHLFEHMMFQESQHVGQDEFFKKIQGSGGTLNGGTGNDGTTYFEVVPKNALEMVLWLEADRMGFLRSKLTHEAFANQQAVVKNEKRQMVDNRPYGHTNYIIGKLLYPENHPYNWQVIGSIKDLNNATLADVREFHEKWYRTNNSTLVVAGDFNKAKTIEWIEKYFGEIKSAGKINDPSPTSAGLEKIKIAYYEDNFAKSPELTIAFPTIEQYHPDSYALSFLGQLLARGKKSPLYKVIVEEKKLAPSVSGYQMSQEITGEFRIKIQAFPKSSLNKVKEAISETFKKFESESFTEQDLARLKAKTETSFYNGMSSILGKSFQLARYNEYAGSPGYVTEDLEKILAVTKEDVLQVYNTYIKNKPYVMTCFIPKGETELIVEGAEPFLITEEPIIAEEIDNKSAEKIKVEKTNSSFDRSVEPAKGPDPEIVLPSIWKDKLSNGLNLIGIEHTELPLIQVSLTLQGGQILDDIDHVGVANLVSSLMMEGTKNKTPIELEEAIDNLGASIYMYTSRESIIIQANCLKSKFSGVYSLVEEILLEPRWDEKEFARLKKETIEGINRGKANPSYISFNVFNNLIYGDDHIFGTPVPGTLETVDKISLGDLKEYYNSYFSPSVSYAAIVGDISREDAINTFKTLEEKWIAKDVSFPKYPAPAPLTKAAVYFVDVPNSKQSVIRIGNISLSHTDADYYPATIMNYKLGGSFNSIVNMILREEKGYTYGAHSGFSGSLYSGTFAASSSVHSMATLESVQIFKEEMTKYRGGISAEDLEFTKNAMVKSNARRFETLGALISMLNSIETYNLPVDNIKKEEKIVLTMTLKKHKELAQKYINPEKMIYLIVGDAATQLDSLEQIGLGKAILIKQ